MDPSSAARAIHRKNLARLVDAVQRRALSVESERVFVLMVSASPFRARRRSGSRFARELRARPRRSGTVRFRRSGGQAR
jgi:hypothetical protein